MAITQENNFSISVKMNHDRDHDNFLTQNKNRKDSFKPLFCEENFYHTHQNSFAQIQKVILRLNVDKVSEVILWTVLLCLLRRPQDWFAGVRKSTLGNLSADKDILIADICEDLKITWPKKLNHQTGLVELLNTVKIKPLPDVVHRALYFIFTQKYPVQILSYEPSALELLVLQSRGQRIITFHNDFENWPYQKFGHRDPLSFWLHDCIHAEHFFSQTENFVSQIGFYKFVKTAIEQQCWDQKQASAGFDGAFSYLISDMNSHPLHLLKTFKAIIDIHFSSSAAAVWEKITGSIQSTPQENDALRKVNTTYFTDEHCAAVMQFAKRLGAQS